MDVLWQQSTSVIIQGLLKKCNLFFCDYAIVW
jgi:hypothetical protein